MGEKKGEGGRGKKLRKDSPKGKAGTEKLTKKIWIGGI